MSDLIKGLMDTCATLEAVLHKTEGERDGLLLQISEERERCAKIVEGKIPIGGPRGMASLVLLTHIAKEIRAGVPLKQKEEPGKPPEGPVAPPDRSFQS